MHANRLINALMETLNKFFTLMVRHARHDRKQRLAVRSKLVEGFTQRFLMLSCLLLSLTGCIGGATPPSQFYLLEPISEIETSETGISAKPVIALRPVRIPRYVDRPQIVTASGKNVYQLSELNRWAESLDGNIGRVLVQNLSLLVPADVVLVNAANRAQQAQLRVSLTILEFHVNPQGQAGMIAQWQVNQDEDMLLNRQVAYQAQASTTDYPAMVAALNDCLNRMSRELAASLRQVLEDRKRN